MLFRSPCQVCANVLSLINSLCENEESEGARLEATCTVLVVFKGLPGCGKTTLSRSLGQRLGWPVVSKDDFSELLDERLTSYGTLAHELMWRVAGNLLAQGFSVICDSTLAAAYNYADAQRTADITGVRLIVVECCCSDPAMWRQRIEARQGQPARYLSDWMDFQEYKREASQKASYPIQSPKVNVDTTEPMESILETLVASIHAISGLKIQVAHRGLTRN